VRAVIAGAGAAIRHLSIDGVRLIPEFDDSAGVPFFSGQVLVPWPNRVRDGRWTYVGRTLQLDISDPVHHTALHGLLGDTTHRVVRRSASSITLGAPITRSPGYPFDLDTTVTYDLAVDGLVTTHRVRNVGSDAAPVAIGAHPFLTISETPTDDLILVVDGTHHIDVDDRLLPVGATAVAGTEWDLREGRAIVDLDLDDCWAVRAAPDGASVHTLRAADGRTVSLWADGHFGFVHAFITREFPAVAGPTTAVALEPMTACADALNSGIGMRWLQPGESLCATWAIRYDDGRR
jgi:aldose 1-epimerase